MIHELTVAETAGIVRNLAEHDPPLPILTDVDDGHTLHLRAQREMTTAEEVVVIGAFLAHHVGRVAWHAWHPAVAS